MTSKQNKSKIIDILSDILISFVFIIYAKRILGEYRLGQKRNNYPTPGIIQHVQSIPRTDDIISLFVKKNKQPGMSFPFRFPEYLLQVFT